MSTISDSIVVDRFATARTTAVAAALVGAISNAGYISTFIFLNGISSKDADTHPFVLTCEILAGLSFVVLALTLPSLASRSRLPGWVLCLTAAGCAFVATNAWTYGLFMADLSGRLTDAEAAHFQDATSGYLIAFWLPKMVLCGIGLLALAIVGWRRRIVPRPACVLLVLAAIVSGWLVAYPPGALLAALALAWTARTVKA
jgi:hypothetical protein